MQEAAASNNNNGCIEDFALGLPNENVI